MADQVVTNPVPPAADPVPAPAPVVQPVILADPTPIPGTVLPPVQAQPAAPAVPPAQPAPVAEAPASDYIAVGDPVADYGLGLLKEAGVSRAEAESYFQKAAESGKLEDVNMQALVQRVGEAKANLVMAGIRDWHTRANAASEVTRKTVYDAVGGEESWQVLAAWVKTNEGKDAGLAAVMPEIRSMIDAGGMQAKYAVMELMTRYNADPRTSGLNNNLLAGTAAPNPADFGPLSKREYQALIGKANDSNDERAVAQLRARRAAGMRAGI